MRPRSLSCRPARCTSAHHIPNDRATSLRGLSATLLLVMLPMALEEAVANGLPAGTLSAFATGIPRLGAAGRQRDEAVCAFDSSRPRCLSALRQARRTRDLARAAAADGTSVGEPSVSNADDSGSSDVGSSPEISAEQKQDETEEALQSDNDMLRVKPRVEEPKGGKPRGRLSRIKRRILTLWDRSGSAHNTSPRANMSSAPQSTGQKKFLTAQRNSSQTPVSYEASMRASDVPGKSMAANKCNKSAASTLGARKQMQLQTSTERNSTASEVAVAAVTAAAAYLPTYETYEAWRQSWNLSSSDYWAYELGYRLSQTAMTGVTSSLNYAGKLIPWRATDDNDAKEQETGANSGDVKTNANPSMQPTLAAPGLNMTAGAKTSTLRRLGRKGGIRTPPGVEFVWQDSHQAGGDETVRTGARIVDDLLSAGGGDRMQSAADDAIEDKALDMDKGTGSLGLGAGESSAAGGRSAADSLTSSSHGYQDFSGCSDGRTRQDGAGRVEDVPRKQRRPRKRDAAKAAARAAAASLRPAAGEMSGEALRDADDSFFNYMQNLAFWRMDWWSTPFDAVRPRQSAVADGAAARDLLLTDVLPDVAAPAPAPGPVGTRGVVSTQPAATELPPTGAVSDSKQLDGQYPPAKVNETSVRDGEEDSTMPTALGGVWDGGLLSLLTTLTPAPTDANLSLPPLVLDLPDEPPSGPGPSEEVGSRVLQDAAIGELLIGLFDGMSPEASVSSGSTVPAALTRDVVGGSPLPNLPAPSATPTAATGAGKEQVACATPEQSGSLSSFELVSSSSGSLADSVIRVLNSLGLDAGKYEQRLADARTTLLQSIGVGGTEALDGYAPPWVSQDAPVFDVGMAVLLAHAAFESYNDPIGGKWEVHPDGTRSAYLSPDFIRQLYDGILQVTVGNLSFEAIAPDSARQVSGGLGSLTLQRNDMRAGGKGGQKAPGSAGDMGAEMALGVLPSAASTISQIGSKTLSTQQRKGLVRLTLPTSENVVEAEDSVTVGSDGRIQEETGCLDFGNQSLFIYTPKGKEFAAGRDRGQALEQKGLVINAAVTRMAGGSLAYLTGEQTPELRARAVVSLSKLQGSEGQGARRLRLPLLATNSVKPRALGSQDQPAPSKTMESRSGSSGRQHGSRWLRQVSGTSASDTLSLAERSVDKTPMSKDSAAIRVPPAVREMDVAQVCAWLQRCELATATSTFEVQGIDGRALVELWELLNTDPTGFYKLVGEMLGMQKLGTSLAFAAELRDLVRCSPPPSLMQPKTPPNHTDLVSFAQGQERTLISETPGGLKLDIPTDRGEDAPNAVDSAEARGRKSELDRNGDRPPLTSSASVAFDAASRSGKDAGSATGPMGLTSLLGYWLGYSSAEDDPSDVDWSEAESSEAALTRAEAVAQRRTVRQLAPTEESNKLGRNKWPAGMGGNFGVPRVSDLAGEAEREKRQLSREQDGKSEPLMVGMLELVATYQPFTQDLASPLLPSYVLYPFQCHAFDQEASSDKYGTAHPGQDLLPAPPQDWSGLRSQASSTFGRNPNWPSMHRWSVLRTRAEAVQTVGRASERNTDSGNFTSPSRDTQRPATPDVGCNMSVGVRGQMRSGDDDRLPASCVASAYGASSVSVSDTMAADLGQDLDPVLSRLGPDPLGEPVCFVEVNSTDTQTVIWRDKERRRIIIAFRGTDADSTGANWRDVLTDLMCFQTDASWIFEGGNTTTKQHGEHTAGSAKEKSERVGDTPTGTENVTTSASGASSEVAEQASEVRAPMAHIGFAIAYASCRDRLWRVLRSLLPESAEDRADWTICSTGHSMGGALCSLFAAECAARLPEAQLIMYNFGAPKVGDDEFVRRFNRLVPNAFRVVNDADVIVRLPRNKGLGALPGAGNYYHAGRTVLTSPESQSPVWVEGESPGKDPLSERWDSLSDLLAAEVRLMQTLVDGRGFMQHVEDGYYQSLLEILRSAQEGVAADDPAKSGSGEQRGSDFSDDMTGEALKARGGTGDGMR